MSTAAQIAETEPQVATPAPTDGTFALAKVPDPQARELKPLSSEETLKFFRTKPVIKDMTLDQKFQHIKDCFSAGYGIRRSLCETFESIRAEFKTYAKDRADMPTVEEAFKQHGLNYHTVYSAIQREKTRRAEDAQFFAAIKAQASDKNIYGVDVTDDLPVGTKVILGDGTKGQVLTAGEKAAPDAEPSFEVVTEEGTAVQVKRGDLVTLASVLAAKKAAKEAKENDPDAEKKETARIAAAAAKEEAALKSSDFYAAQYFALVALVNAAPKELTPSEFAQTLNDNLRVAYEGMSEEEAKKVKPAPKLFPAIAQGNENKLFTFLSADAVGRKSLINAVFGGLESSFRGKVEKFAQRICDKFYDGKYKVTVTDKTQPVPPEAIKTAAVPPLQPNQPPTTRVGDKSEPTAHGYYYEFVRTGGRPYAVKQVGVEKARGVLCSCKNKADADLKVATYEREAAAVAIKATEAI